MMLGHTDNLVLMLDVLLHVRVNSSDLESPDLKQVGMYTYSDADVLYVRHLTFTKRILCKCIFIKVVKQIIISIGITAIIF